MEIYENLDLNDLDGEIWKEICGYNGDYHVSNLGRIKSFKKYGGINERILEPIENNDGYLFINLCKNGKCKPKRIHRLMYENFIGKIPKGFVIHHIDFTTNNTLENFQMMTNGEHLSKHHTGLNHSEETKELLKEINTGENHPMFGKNRPEHSEKMKGENNSRSTLTEKKVIQIRLLCDEGILTQKEIAKMFGVSQETISYIKNRKIWKHI